MNKTLAFAFVVAASPALAAEGAFFSLRNTNFVTLIAFLVFIGILLWQRVPRMLGRALDDRAQMIRNELDEARLLREEAQALVASYDAKMKEVAEQSARIVAGAKDEAKAAAAQAKADLQSSIARRVAAAEDQINAAVKAAEVAVRNEAITVSIQVAAEVLQKQMTKDGAAASVEAAIEEVAARLH
jgi:F-type H+-transporting ATPase subunit b